MRSHNASLTKLNYNGIRESSSGDLLKTGLILVGDPSDKKLGDQPPPAKSPLTKPATNKSSKAKAKTIAKKSSIIKRESPEPSQGDHGMTITHIHINNNAKS